MKEIEFRKKGWKPAKWAEKHSTNFTNDDIRDATAGDDPTGLNVSLSRRRSRTGE